MNTAQVAKSRLVTYSCRLLSLLAFFIICALILYGCSLAVVRMEAHRATSFLRSVSSIRLGDLSGSPKVGKVLREARGAAIPLRDMKGVSFSQRQADEKCQLSRYGTWDSPDSERSHLATRVMKWIRRFVPKDYRHRLELRDWIVEGEVCEIEGRVSSLDATVVTEGVDIWLEADWSLSREMPEHVRYVHPESASQNVYIRWGHVNVGGETGEMVKVYLTSKAGNEELNKATLDTRCLNAGCCEMHDLLPLAAEKGVTGVFPAVPKCELRKKNPWNTPAP